MLPKVNQYRPLNDTERGKKIIYTVNWQSIEKFIKCLKSLPIVTISKSPMLMFFEDLDGRCLSLENKEMSIAGGIKKD